MSPRVFLLFLGVVVAVVVAVGLPTEDRRERATLERRAAWIQRGNDGALFLAVKRIEQDARKLREAKILRHADNEAIRELARDWRDCNR